MLKHYHIEHIGNTNKPGIGFDAYKFATEHQLSGSITFQTSNKFSVHIEGNMKNTAAFISWYLTDVVSEYAIDNVAIYTRPLHYNKEFTINNLSKET